MFPHCRRNSQQGEEVSSRGEQVTRTPTHTYECRADYQPVQSWTLQKHIRIWYNYDGMAICRCRRTSFRSLPPFTIISGGQNFSENFFTQFAELRQQLDLFITVGTAIKWCPRSIWHNRTLQFYINMHIILFIEFDVAAHIFHIEIHFISANKFDIVLQFQNDYHLVQQFIWTMRTIAYSFHILPTGMQKCSVCIIIIRIKIILFACWPELYRDKLRDKTQDTIWRALLSQVMGTCWLVSHRWDLKTHQLL